MRNEIDRVGNPSVLRQASVFKVNRTRVRVDRRVFKNGAKFDGTKNLWFALVGQPKTLCVTTAFDIKNPTICPAVFVISDQIPMWIGR